MRWTDLAEQDCSVARTVAVIGDRWTLMILRDLFLGVRRFEDFERRLGISRSIIAERLKTLVDEGVLRREAYQDRPVRHEYRLTDKVQWLSRCLLIRTPQEAQLSTTILAKW